MYNVVWTAPVRRMGPFVSALVLGALVFAAAAADGVKDAKNPTLEEALREQTPTILNALWEKMDHPQDALHVGVLKFHVQSGEKPSRENIVTPNLYLTRRLEAALILGLKEEDKVRVLHNPGEEATKRCNLQTEQGRKAFFDKGPQRYRPAWGNDNELIPAHVFLTGLVKIQDAGLKAEVVVQAFDRRGKTPEEVCRFPIATDPRLLSEAGINCVISRGSDPKDWAVAMADTSGTPANDKAPATKEFPDAKKLLEQSPIDVQILYNGKKQKVREDGTVREPTPNDVVTFRLKHKNNDEKTYGVILKVNGQNTLLPDDADADDFLRCYKWIVKPHTEFEIEGYQKDLRKRATKFKVSSAAQSRSDAAFYGENAGLFTILVLEGRRDDEKPQIVEARPDDVVAIGRGIPNRLGGFGSLKALQGHLLEAASCPQAKQEVVSKGLIQQGADTEQQVEEIPFRASAKRIPVIQVRYYKGSGEK